MFSQSVIDTALLEARTDLLVHSILHQCQYTGATMAMYRN